MGKLFVLLLVAITGWLYWPLGIGIAVSYLLWDTGRQWDKSRRRNYRHYDD